MKRRTTVLSAMPESLKAEHEYLRADLEHAIRAGGRIGEAARALSSLLRTHFRREEENVFLALGLLQSVAQGKIVPAMHKVVAMTERLKSELPEMVDEHGRIRKALERLGKTATEEGSPKVAQFAASLLRHARMEEEVLYPAAIVLGEYLRTRLVPVGAATTGEAR
jgi:hypothetical protein